MFLWYNINVMLSALAEDTSRIVRCDALHEYPLLYKEGQNE